MSLLILFYVYIYSIHVRHIYFGPLHFKEKLQQVMTYALMATGHGQHTYKLQSPFTLFLIITWFNNILL